MSAIPPIAEWISACNLRQKGNEWVGGCPITGDGDDRFHVRVGNNGETLVGCRGGLGGCAAAGQCMDRQSREVKTAKLFDVMRAVGLSANSGDTTSQSAVGKSNRKRIDEANRIWNDARSIVGTPAEVYLRETRRVWPSRMPFPDSVRWWPASEQDAARNPIHAGAIVWRYLSTPYANPDILPGEVAAVHYEVLMTTGELPLTGRIRRTYGMPNGAVCAVGNPKSEVAFMVEGPVTAMAALWLAESCGYPDAQAISIGSYLCFDSVYPVLQRQCHIEVWPDNGAESYEAAHRFQNKMREVSTIPVTIDRMHTTEQGSDAADLLQLYIDAGLVSVFN